MVSLSLPEIYKLNVRSKNLPLSHLQTGNEILTFMAEKISNSILGTTKPVYSVQVLATLSAPVADTTLINGKGRYAGRVSIHNLLSR